MKFTFTLELYVRKPVLVTKNKPLPTLRPTEHQQIASHIIGCHPSLCTTSTPMVSVQYNCHATDRKSNKIDKREFTETIDVGY